VCGGNNNIITERIEKFVSDLSAAFLKAETFFFGD
jgi:hypothetical protein